MSWARFNRLAFNVIAGVAILLVASVALWIRTEIIGWTQTLIWSKAGAYHSLELSADNAKYIVLYDAGIQPAPLSLRTTRGWVNPPWPTSSTVAHIRAIVVLPQPRSEFGALETRHLWMPYLGVDYGEFDEWYGPGTVVHSYRISYFVVMLPAAAVTLLWIGIRLREWRRRRRPGFCAKCGYDLRASADRCPESGTAIAQPT